MGPSIVHLPNGQTLTVTPVFGGLFFKSNDLSNNHSVFPAGWTIGLHPETEEDVPAEEGADEEDYDAYTPRAPTKKHVQHRYKQPSLQDDHLYISSISNPSSSEFKPASSPTRQIAMMLWATLWWYFHQPEPDARVTNGNSVNTAEAGKPRGEWRININREGVFKSKVILPKLERMGLIMTEDSSVGTDPDQGTGEGWTNMFVSRRAFWQLDPRIYLFTLSPLAQSPYPSGSPYASRPGSPTREHKREQSGEAPLSPSVRPQSRESGLWSPSITAPGPFHSSSHLPTYYPPAPPQYTFTNYIRHPIRSKPPRQGEIFYTRFVPGCGQYLSFRVASLSDKAPLHRGPVASLPATHQFMHTQSLSDGSISGMNQSLTQPNDVDLLHKWMNDPRVSHFWGESGPREHQEAFLRNNLQSKHSFPVIGCWDGKPFGYFELYWVKEDNLGKYLGGSVGDHDRGIHCLIGEQEFRGPKRVKCWLSALVHYLWLADMRTEAVMLEPRVDNEKLAQYCREVGFFKEREVTFPHKQSNLMKVYRSAWEAPET